MSEDGRMKKMREIGIEEAENVIAQPEFGTEEDADFTTMITEIFVVGHGTTLIIRPFRMNPRPRLTYRQQRIFCPEKTRSCWKPISTGMSFRLRCYINGSGMWMEKMMWL
jgi:hypothetical protein